MEKGIPGHIKLNQPCGKEAEAAAAESVFGRALRSYFSFDFFGLSLCDLLLYRIIYFFFFLFYIDVYLTTYTGRRDAASANTTQSSRGRHMSTSARPRCP